MKSNVAIWASRVARLSSAFLIFCSDLALAGCAAAPKYEPPETLAKSDKLVVYAPGMIDKFTRADSADVLYTAPENLTCDAAVTIFENASPDVEVDYQVIPYGNGEYAQRLQTEMMGGGGPDVVMIHPLAFADIYKTMDGGVFLDLAKIMENDEGYSPDDYFQGVMKGGMYKGGQYMIPISFDAPLFVGSAAELYRIGFDAENVTDAVSLLEEARRCLAEGRENGAFQRVFSYSALEQLRLLWQISGIRLIDYENKKAMPDEQRLRELVEAAKALMVASGETADNAKTPDDSTVEDYLNGKMWFAKCGAVQYIHGYTRVLSRNGGHVAIMPAQPGGGIKSTFSQAAAVRAASPNQENAYNFIKVLLSGRIQQSQNVTLIGAPVRKQSLVNFMKATENIILYKGSGKDAPEFIVDMMDTITDSKLNSYDSYTLTEWHGDAPGDIFWDRITPYFTEDASLDGCLKEAREALELYVSE
jgi:ABC-type glycerol-3-phosphate transport system substrate-binding protein